MAIYNRWLYMAICRETLPYHSNMPLPALGGTPSPAGLSCVSAKRPAPGIPISADDSWPMPYNLENIQDGHQPLLHSVSDGGRHWLRWGNRLLWARPISHGIFSVSFLRMYHSGTPDCFRGIAYKLIVRDILERDVFYEFVVKDSEASKRWEPGR